MYKTILVAADLAKPAEARKLLETGAKAVRARRHNSTAAFAARPCHRRAAGKRDGRASFPFR